MMLTRIAQHWPVVFIVAMLAYIVYAFVVPPPWAERKFGFAPVDEQTTIPSAVVGFLFGLE